MLQQVGASLGWPSCEVWCPRAVGVVAGAVTLVAANPAAAQTPTEPFEISDNSFLVEEALNQEPGIFQNIVNSPVVQRR